MVKNQETPDCGADGSILGIAFRATALTSDVAQGLGLVVLLKNRSVSMPRPPNNKNVGDDMVYQITGYVDDERLYFEQSAAMNFPGPACRPPL